MAGFPFGDVVSWLFVSWLCVDWLLTISSQLGGSMENILKTTTKTGLEMLAALRGLEAIEFHDQRHTGREPLV